MLKLISIICLTVLVFITNGNSQDRITKRAIPENFPMERFHEISKPNELRLIKVDDSELLLQKIDPQNLQRTSSNQLIDIFEKEECNANDARRTCNKMQLNNGFLLFEMFYLQWDGSNWVNNYKRSYTYDGNNSLIELLYQTWDGFDWANCEKNSYTYDENNIQTETLREIWNVSSWVNFKKFSYLRDGSNNLTERIEQTWNGSEWLNVKKYSYSYDGNNNLKEWIWQDWGGSDWVNTDKISGTFDGHNNNTESLWQTWGGSDWLNVTKYSSTWDGNYNLIERVEQAWDGSDWVNVQKDSYMHDGNNNLTGWLYQIWWDGTFWMNAQQNFYTYDLNNNLIEDLGQWWDGSDWWNVNKVSYAFDINNNKIEEIYQSGIGNLYNQNRQLFAYDGNNNPTNVIWQDWDGSDWVDVTMYSSTYIPVTGVHEILSATNFFTLSNNYPNPFNPSTKISWQAPVSSWQTLKVYDVLGCAVATLVDDYKTAGNYEIEFDASNLTSGTYFYQFTAGSFIETKKMILLK